MTHRKGILGICLLLVLLIVACQAPADTPEPTAPPQEAEMANPASQNCIDQGGTLAVEQRGDGGDIGVCYFEDNQQCEEWALMRGECPVGGVKVTGYTTPAARYCAISGGTYAITGTNDSGEEQGTCTLPSGAVCDVWDYYNGECSSETGAQPSTPTEGWQTFANPEAGYSLQAPPIWSEETLPDQNEGAMHGMAYTGPEGGVEVYWGFGFGGACPSGYEPVQLAVSEAQTCHTTNADGTEEWNQISYEVPGGNSFSARAYTSTAEQSSRDLVLQVLSTLAFTEPAAADMAVPADWQTYTDPEVGFSLQMPLTWTQTILPDQNEGAIHGMAFAGTEGAVEVYWGVGFGGACPSGTEPVQLAVGELQACYTTNADGTESWEQIGYEVSGGNSFSTRAYTSNSEPASHDLVLQVLSTLNFMPPEQAHAGETIQPLSMEVCDGLAQAMSHTLDDLIPTQSEAPLEDFVTGASGTGCQATVTGTGLDFESPDAVVNELGSMLEDEGYTQDPMLAAGGPTAIGLGYRNGDQMCQAVAGWQPDDSANCPDDQPISACEVTPEQQLYTVTLNCGVEVPAG